MRNIREDLNQVKVEPDSGASSQAKKLGLQYAGFGRYVDPRTQQVTHIVQNDKLVPFNRAVKTNTFQANNTDDYGNYATIMAPQIQQLHEFMATSYSPENYDDAELDAIYAYTSDSYPDINSRLASVPTGTPANKIEKTAVDDKVPEFVATMDSAMKRVRVPADFMTFVNLSSDYNIQDLIPGRVFKFKGYRNTSINLNTVLNNAQSQQTSFAGRPQVIVLQLMVPKNSRGIYAADFAPNAEDGEFILPRGTTVEIVGEPSNVVGSDAMSQNLNLEVVYIDCKVKA